MRSDQTSIYWLSNRSAVTLVIIANIFQDLEKILTAFPVDLSLCRNAVDGNKDTPYRWELYRKEQDGARLERVRKGLWEIGNLALQAQSGEDVQGAQSHWKRFAYTPKQNVNGNIEILVSRPMLQGI